MILPNHFRKRGGGAHQPLSWCWSLSLTPHDITPNKQVIQPVFMEHPRTPRQTFGLLRTFTVMKPLTGAGRGVDATGVRCMTFHSAPQDYLS